MWNVSSGKTWGPDRHRGPLLTRKEPLTCQSRHSSVNSCLILCWKLVGCRILKADRRLKVEWMTIPPPDSESIRQSSRHSWLRGKNLIGFFFGCFFFFVKPDIWVFNIKAAALLVTVILMKVILRGNAKMPLINFCRWYKMSFAWERILQAQLAIQKKEKKKREIHVLKCTALYSACMGEKKTETVESIVVICVGINKS